MDVNKGAGRRGGKKGERSVASYPVQYGFDRG